MTEEGRGVPLSEDEQRILSEIEQRLYETDPQLVREVGSTTVYTAAARALKWSALAFVVGTVLMVLTLQVHYMVAFLGFLMMLAAALAFVHNARRLGRVGMQQFTQRLPAGGVRDLFGGSSPRATEQPEHRDSDD